MTTETSAAERPGIQSKLTCRGLAQRIQLFTDEGLSASEIGARLGMSRQRVMRTAALHGIRLQPRGGARRVSAQFSGRRYEVIAALAQQAGCSVGAMLVRLAAITIDEGTHKAARKLGRDARPRRAYSKRGR
jgi:hypothetical protein